MDEETKIREFSRLFKEMLYCDFLESGIKKGKPSKYILATSRIMKRVFSENMGKKERDDYLRIVEKENKRITKELLEVIKTSS